MHGLQRQAGMRNKQEDSRLPKLITGVTGCGRSTRSRMMICRIDTRARTQTIEMHFRERAGMIFSRLGISAA